MQKIALFDIDYTLFNTRYYRKELFTSLANRLHYPNPDDFVTKAEGAVIQARKVLPSFDPKSYAPFLKEALQIDIPQSDIEILMYDEIILDKARYEEVMHVFQELTNHNIQIGIFSTGANEFQLSKIKPFRHFIHDKYIYIHSNKQGILKELLLKFKKEKIYLVDDLLSLLKQAKEIDKQVTTIWVRRGRLAESTLPFTDFNPDLEITNLTQIVDFITKK